MTASATFPTNLDLPRLMQRLARLVQEMGDRGLQGSPHVSASTLRTAYLQLLRQATHLSKGLGIGELEAADYVATQLIAQLRRGSSQRMSLREALGELTGV